MRRSGCYGKCPSYTVQLAADGAVVFSGERYVAATGTHTGQAGDAGMKALRDLLDAPEIAALHGDYTPSAGKRCGTWATDFPTVSIDIVSAGAERSIRHYLGCEAAPPALQRLEKAIDDTAGVGQWVDAAPLR